MNLSEDDIINVVESYKNKWKKSQAEMAIICGMTNASVYNKWVNKKTEGGKIEYLLSFINNTNTNLFDFISKKKLSDKNQSEEPDDEVYSCPDCPPREKKIREQEKEIYKLKDKLSDLNEKYANCLEELLGKKGKQSKNSA